MNIDLDIIDGARVEDTTNGLVVTRRHHVTGLDATQGHTSRLYQALSAPGVVDVGGAHPTIPGVVCSSCLPESDGSVDGCWITETFTTPATQTTASTKQQPVIEIGATSEIVQTDFDSDGNLITVDYKDPAGVPHTAHVTVPKKVARPFLRITQRLGTVGINTLLGDVVANVGKRSDGGGLLTLPGPEQDAPWLCECDKLVTTDLGKTYTRIVEFTFDEQQWQQAAAYLDPNTHQIPTDANLGNGKREDIQVYKIGKFNF